MSFDAVRDDLEGGCGRFLARGCVRKWENICWLWKKTELLNSIAGLGSGMER